MKIQKQRLAAVLAVMMLLGCGCNQKSVSPGIQATVQGTVQEAELLNADLPQEGQDPLANEDNTINNSIDNSENNNVENNADSSENNKETSDTNEDPLNKNNEVTTNTGSSDNKSDASSEPTEEKEQTQLPVEKPDVDNEQQKEPEQVVEQGKNNPSAKPSGPSTGKPANQGTVKKDTVPEQNKEPTLEKIPETEKAPEQVPEQAPEETQTPSVPPMPATPVVTDTEPSDSKPEVSSESPEQELISAEETEVDNEQKTEQQINPTEREPEPVEDIVKEPEEKKASGWGQYLLVSVLSLIAAAEAFYIFKLRLWKREKREIQELITIPLGENAAPEPIICDIAEEQPVIVGKVHGQGKREEQQDSFAVTETTERNAKGLLAIVADGMGGLTGGAQVSQQIVNHALQGFYEKNEEPEQMLPLLMRNVKMAVDELLYPHGMGRSGSTVVMGLLHEKSFYYISVGDSRICLYRGGVLYQLNRTHTYLYDLYREEINGDKTPEEIYAIRKTDGLTSYMGMGELKYVDIPSEPVQVCAGDRFVLMSDGVFNALSNEELCNALQQDAQQAAQMITQLIEEKNYRNQDNYTAVILQC